MGGAVHFSHIIGLLRASGLYETTLKEPSLQILWGALKVAALQPAARGQEPRYRKPAERKALAGLARGGSEEAAEGPNEAISP